MSVIWKTTEPKDPEGSGRIWKDLEVRRSGSSSLNSLGINGLPGPQVDFADEGALVGMANWMGRMDGKRYRPLAPSLERARVFFRPA